VFNILASNPSAKQVSNGNKHMHCKFSAGDRASQEILCHLIGPLNLPTYVIPHQPSPPTFVELTLITAVYLMISHFNQLEMG